MAGHGLGITRWPGKRGMVRERRLDWHGMSNYRRGFGGDGMLAFLFAGLS